MAEVSFLPSANTRKRASASREVANTSNTSDIFLINTSACGNNDLKIISHSILICSIFHLNWRVAHLIQLDVTCKFGLTMQLICHSILICSIFHLNWRVAHLIQLDVTCKLGLTMQLQHVIVY